MHYTEQTNITEDYSQAVENLRSIHGSFTPSLMALVRISNACSLDMPLSEALDHEQSTSIAYWPSMTGIILTESSQMRR